MITTCHSDEKITEVTKIYGVASLPKGYSDGKCPDCHAQTLVTFVISLSDVPDPNLECQECQWQG